MPWLDNPKLECQDCGTTIKMLTAAEAQRVAERPYDYVVYCWSCQTARKLGIPDE